MITVCGNNQMLQETLVRSNSAASVLGWTDRMPELMESGGRAGREAGGLTAMEALHGEAPRHQLRVDRRPRPSQRPVVDDASVSRCRAHAIGARGGAVPTTTNGPGRGALITRESGRALFAHDPAARIVALAGARDGTQEPVAVASIPSRVAASR